ncbi:MAG: HPr family phosphocarrier protein [Candidatus Oxydemutatoraceae bacterium WSBS_2016_MAG_OTU14]
MLQQDIKIINKLGLHARAAAKLVTLASRFESNIELKKGEQTINAKSIMGVLMLAASQGTDLQLAIDGKDESEAVLAIAGLINNRFEEDE